MSRLLIVLALAVPLLALADGKKKSKPDVDIWPPPAPDTDQAGNKPKPKPEPKPEDVPDAGSHFELDPELRGDPMAGTKPDPDPIAKSNDDDDDDACDDAFDSCKEDCTVEHATDDTLHVAKGKKLPVHKCLARCESKRATCEEQHEAGFKGKDDE